MTRRAAQCLCIAAFFVSYACSSDPKAGYSFSPTYPADVKTVTIPVFDNYTFTPGIEVELTEAIIKQVQASTDMKVTTAEKSDTRLNGVVTSSQLRRLTLARSTGLVQEQAVQLTVDFQWIDNRSGKTLVTRRNFAATDTFVPARPTGERIEVGQHAVIQRLAHDIVAEMRSAW
jgi:hypothetical protein